MCCQDALDLRTSKQIGWRNLHHVSAQVNRGSAGGQHGLRVANWYRGITSGTDCEESRPRSDVRRCLPSHPTSRSSRQAPNEASRKRSPARPVHWIDPSEGWGFGLRGGANCPRLMAPLSDDVDLVLEWRRWLT